MHSKRCTAWEYCVHNVKREWCCVHMGLGVGGNGYRVFRGLSLSLDHFRIANLCRWVILRTLGGEETISGSADGWTLLREREISHELNTSTWTIYQWSAKLRAHLMIFPLIFLTFLGSIPCVRQCSNENILEVVFMASTILWSVVSSRKESIRFLGSSGSVGLSSSLAGSLDVMLLAAVVLPATAAAAEWQRW